MRQHSGPWRRTPDRRQLAILLRHGGTVALGAINAGQTFICTCPDDPVVVGTSLIAFASQQAVATQRRLRPRHIARDRCRRQDLTIPAGKASRSGNGC